MGMAVFGSPKASRRTVAAALCAEREPSDRLETVDRGRQPLTGDESRPRKRTEPVGSAS
jgi:hypothetical protein